MTPFASLRAAVRRAGRAVAAGALGLGLVAALAPLPAAAQAPAEAAPAPAPALWAVRDADSTIWLFGTVHLLRPDAAWMSDGVAAAFEAADELVLELDDPGDQAAAMPLIQQYGLDPENPLSSRLSEAEFARLDAAARTVGLSGPALDPMRPWLASLTLSMAPLMAAGYDPAAGVDMVLRAQALEAGKPVRGLETMEQQIRFFAEMDEAKQLAFLRETLDSFAEAAEMLDGMAAAWAAGDAEALFAEGGAEMKAAHPELYDVLLTRRNADWADQIETMLEGSGTHFVAVGALHLAGPDSVQRQLEARGHRVERH